jgi:hypothetical protein
MRSHLPLKNRTKSTSVIIGRGLIPINHRSAIASHSPDQRIIGQGVASNQNKSSIKRAPVSVASKSKGRPKCYKTLN